MIRFGHLMLVVTRSTIHDCSSAQRRSHNDEDKDLEDELEQYRTEDHTPQKFFPIIFGMSINNPHTKCG